MTQRVKTILAIGAILLIAFLLIRSCKKPEKIYIKVPVTTGTFEKQKPIYIVKENIKYITKWKTKDSLIVYETINPVNQDLVNKYKIAKDSIDKFKLYVDAVQIRDFTLHYQDSILDIFIDGKTQGELDYAEPRYTIKERQLKIYEPEKKLKFRMLAGVELRSNIKRLDYSINLGLQNAKGSIYRVGYSKQIDGNYFMLGYDHPIFSKTK